MTVRVVTDSTAHLAPDVVRALNVSIVPHHILIDGREYLDGVDLTESDFNLLVYEQGQVASTQPPTVEEFYAVYRDLNQESSDIVSIHVSEVLSDTVANARQAAGMLLGRCKIVVIDSQTLSMGLGILVETAARAAASGQSLDEIVRTVRGLVPQIYIVFFSENLEYLERGGRIGHAQALLGTMLGIRPFLTLEEGEIRPMEKVRTREEALEKLVEFVSEFDTVEQLYVIRGSFTPQEEIDLLLERFKVLFPDLAVPVVSYGPVVASHIGPHTLGVIVYERAEFTA